ncbi:hypothetical protein ACFQ1S_38930 [Kibdelosporangium lantanae]|uniref:Uncharacterized protein n=1 Tax=Kibdelosporangium lantanae TaxID=1497396 RepID=A0ABW3MLK8_9PSEU
MPDMVNGAPTGVAAGTHTVTVTVADRNPASGGDNIALDYVEVTS